MNFTHNSTGAPDSTGTVGIGRYRLEVGATPGTVIAPGPDSDVPAGLAEALSKAPSERQSPGKVIGDAVASASEVTDDVAEALELFKAVVEGRLLDTRELAGRIDRLLAAVERLDASGRSTDALRLARALCGLLALTMRWLDLIRALDVALRAATKLGDLTAEAWVKHELGTLHLAADRSADAERCLGEAQAIRARLGEQAALAATQRNLLVLCRR